MIQITDLLRRLRSVLCRHLHTMLTNCTAYYCDFFFSVVGQRSCYFGHHRKAYGRRSSPKQANPFLDEDKIIIIVHMGQRFSFHSINIIITAI